MPSNPHKIHRVEGTPIVHPTAEYLAHLIDRISVHLREAEQGGMQRAGHHLEMAKTYAAVYRAVRP